MRGKIMKEKNKKILKDLGNITGYTVGIGLSATILWIFHRVNKYGRECFQEPNKAIILTEVGMAGASTLFLSYKLIKSIIDRHSLDKD